MNLATEFPQIITRLGWAVVHSLWEGVAIGIALALVLMVLRRGSAASRHAACLLAMIAMIAALAITAYRVAIPKQSAEPAQSASIVETSVVIASTDAAPSLATPRSNSGLVFRARVSACAPWIGAAWMMGILAMALRHAGGAWRVRSLRTRGLVQVPEEAQRIFVRLVERFNVRGAVRLLESSRAAVPMLTGIFRPVILLPVRVATGLGVRELEAVLAHELAHLVRRDLWTNLVQILSETVFFYHPAMWWITYRARIEREHAADDLALSVCTDRREYATALARLVELDAAPAHAIAATGGNLLNRVRRILGHPVKSEPAGAGWIVALVAMIAAATILPLRADERAAIPPVRGNAIIQEKLTKLIIPKLEFREATVRDAVAYLRKKSVELDTTEPNPSKRGVNIVLNLNAGGPPSPGSSDPFEARITVSLAHVPLGQALTYVANLAGLKIRMGASSVTLVRQDAPELLVTREYKLRPEFGPATAGSGGRVDAKPWLESLGVPFPTGASATYFTPTHRLVVQNSAENLDLIDLLVVSPQTSASSGPQDKSPGGIATRLEGTERMASKLAKIILPKVEFRDATLREVADFLRRKSIELDVSESDPSRKGVNFVVNLEGSPSDPATLAASGDARLTLSLSNIPLGEALKFTTQSLGLNYRVEPYSVSIMPMSAPQTLITKEYNVSQQVMLRIVAVIRPAPGSKAPSPADPKSVFEAAGVQFPKDASATYFSATNRLVVRNTQENLALIDTLIEATQAPPVRP